MRAIACVAVILALPCLAFAAPQDTKPAEAAAAAFVQTITAKDFEAFKALCATKLQAEHAKNPKNCHITRWWEAVQKELDQQHAKWTFKQVASNLPKNVTLTYTRTTDQGEAECRIGVILDGEKWLVDSAGSL